MAQTTVTQLSVAEFASSLGMSAETVLEQLNKAGVVKGSANDLLTEPDKSRLLDYLRRAHGAADTKTKITLTRRETSEIRAQDAQGKSRTVQVEVRKKRVLVKRDIPELRPEAAAEPITVPIPEPVPAPAPEPVPEVAPVSVAEPVVVSSPEPVQPPVLEPVAPPVEIAPAPELKAAEEVKPKTKARSKPSAEDIPAQQAAPETAKAAEKQEDKPKTASPGKPVVKKVVIRASIIGGVIWLVLGLWLLSWIIS